MKDDPIQGLRTLRKYAGVAGGLAVGTIGALTVKDHVPVSWVEALSLQKPEHFQFVGAVLGTVIGGLIYGVGSFIAKFLEGVGSLATDATRWMGRQLDRAWVHYGNRRLLRRYLADLRELRNAKAITEADYKRYTEHALKNYRDTMFLVPEVPAKMEANQSSSSNGETGT